MKNFPIIDINQRKEGKKPIPTPARGREMDGKRMRNENGKDEGKGIHGVMGRYKSDGFLGIMG